MACGNNKATRDMVASIGGLAVGASVQAAASKREALERVMGHGAVAKSPVRWEAAERRDYYVTEDGTRTSSPRGLDRDRHVHVTVAPDRNPNAVMVQLTDRTQTVGSLDTRGHHDLILFLQKPSEARIRAAEESLVAILRRGSRAKP